MKALVLTVAVAVLSNGQQGERINASWLAEFEGRTFIRLELKTINDMITGGISLGNFEVDAQGLVRRVDDASPSLTPISDVTRRASTVTFFQKGGDDHFEFRLLDTGGADLELILDDEAREELAASGIPMPKPIRLRKVG